MAPQRTAPRRSVRNNRISSPPTDVTPEVVIPTSNHASSSTSATIPTSTQEVKPKIMLKLGKQKSSNKESSRKPSLTPPPSIEDEPTPATRIKSKIPKSTTPKVPKPNPKSPVPSPSPPASAPKPPSASISITQPAPNPRPKDRSPSHSPPVRSAVKRLKSKGESSSAVRAPTSPVSAPTPPSASIPITQPSPIPKPKARSPSHSPPVRSSAKRVKSKGDPSSAVKAPPGESRDAPSTKATQVGPKIVAPAADTPTPSDTTTPAQPRLKKKGVKPHVLTVGSTAGTPSTGTATTAAKPVAVPATSSQPSLLAATLGRLKTLTAVSGSSTPNKAGSTGSASDAKKAKRESMKIEKVSRSTNYVSTPEEQAEYDSHAEKRAADRAKRLARSTGLNLNFARDTYRLDALNKDKRDIDIPGVMDINSFGMTEAIMVHLFGDVVPHGIRRRKEMEVAAEKKKAVEVSAEAEISKKGEGEGQAGVDNPMEDSREEKVTLEVPQTPEIPQTPEGFMDVDA